MLPVFKLAQVAQLDLRCITYNDYKAQLANNRSLPCPKGLLIFGYLLDSKVCEGSVLV